MAFEELSSTNRSIEMSLVKNGLALVGLFVISKLAWKGYNSHVKAPLEKKLADIMEDESETASRIRQAVVASEQAKAVTKVRNCAYRAAGELGLVSETATKLANRTEELFKEEIAAS